MAEWMPSQATTASARSTTGVPAGSARGPGTPLSGRAHPGVVLADGGAAVTGHQRVGPQPLPHRGRQHRLQIAAVDGELRPLVTGGGAGRFGVDVLGETGEEQRLLG